MEDIVKDIYGKVSGGIGVGGGGGGHCDGVEKQYMGLTFQLGFDIGRCGTNKVVTASLISSSLHKVLLI